MSLADPYSPCPCGSGQKYKWCCLKSEPYFERALRLEENGQLEMALKPLDEGLAKSPDSPLLSMRKAYLLLNLGQFEAGREVLDDILKRHPKHLSALSLRLHVLLELEGPSGAALAFQQAWSAAGAPERLELAPVAQAIGAGLAAQNSSLAAARHFELAMRGVGEVASISARHFSQLENSPTVPLAEKNPYTLAPAPESAPAEFRASFGRALEWARDGLWEAAAAAFELLSADPRGGAIADRNQGLCRLWFADDQAGLEAIRRFIARTPPGDDVLELEVLCQEIDDLPEGERVDLVQLSWPLRDRARLFEAIAGDRAIVQARPRLLDDDDPESPVVEAYLLLDRQRIEAAPGLTHDQIPQAEAQLLIGKDSLWLEALDDGRLDRLTDRVLALASRAIPPAHPRTKIVERWTKHSAALMRHPSFPADLPQGELKRLGREGSAHVLVEVWPKTPNPYLDWRTPFEASSIPELVLTLRAVLLRLRCTNEDWVASVDWDSLYRRLKLEPERAVDPVSVDVASLHLCRLGLVPIESLDDDRLIALYGRANRYGVRLPRNAAARRIAERPDLLARPEVDPRTILALLVIETGVGGDRAGADAWLRQGRELEARRRDRDPLFWDLVELQLRMNCEQPESWVPYLAVLLERAKSNVNANTRVLLRLVQLGLVRILPDSSRAEGFSLDLGILEGFLKEFGPRVQTADGRIGLGDRQDRVWTPNQAPAGGGIWTPGSTAGPAERPPLILPGQ